MRSEEAQGTLGGEECQLGTLGLSFAGLQKTCVSKPRRTQVGRALRGVGASIIFSDIDAQDVRRRGDCEGVRLGSGVACIAFHPWRTASVEEAIPLTECRKRVKHRLLSSVVSNGLRRIIVHVIYIYIYIYVSVQGRTGIAGPM